MSRNILFKNLLGEFVFDSSYKLTKKDKKHVSEPSEKDLREILHHFKDPEFFNSFRTENLAITKQKIKESVTEDLQIIQLSNCLDELGRAVNSLSNRLREWLSYEMPNINPEHIDDSVEFPHDIAVLVKTISELKSRKEEQETNLDRRMKKLCPNIRAVAGLIVGARLIAIAGSLERLAKSAASKVQLLGAEAALFRHLRTGSRPPKHGVIHEHPYVMQAGENTGRAARRLADKISIAAKIDFFKGEFMGDELCKQLGIK